MQPNLHRGLSHLNWLATKHHKTQTSKIIPLYHRCWKYSSHFDTRSAYQLMVTFSPVVVSAYHLTVTFSPVVVSAYRLTVTLYPVVVSAYRLTVTLYFQVVSDYLVTLSIK